MDNYEGEYSMDRDYIITTEEDYEQLHDPFERIFWQCLSYSSKETPEEITSNDWCGLEGDFWD